MLFNPLLGGCVFLIGGPGTGKSEVIHTMVQREHPRILQTGTTGAASFVINGNTLHSVFFLWVKGLELTENQKIKLRARLNGKTGIIVDESSMLGWDLIYDLERVLRLYAPRVVGARFGGYRMIFSGDFAQCPPVLTGRPFHTHQFFADFEVVRLTHCFRVADNDTLRVHEHMRWGVVTSEDAEHVRKTCHTSCQPQKALAYSTDIQVPHIVTTNKEVHIINLEYILDMARATGKKIFSILSPRGKRVLFLEGTNLVVPFNVNVANGIANGTRGTAVGVLFQSYDEDVIDRVADKARCVLVRPLGEGVDVLWAEAVRDFLREEGVDEVLVQAVFDATKGLIPIPYCSKKEERGEGATSNQAQYVNSMPLMVNRAATVYKFQGTSLPKCIITFGKREMIGCAFTSMTRCSGGCPTTLVSGDWDTETFMALFNTDVPPDFDIKRIDERLKRMAEATTWRQSVGGLYQAVYPPAPPPQHDVQIGPAW
jgi:hypothetical protein